MANIDRRKADRAMKQEGRKEEREEEPKDKEELMSLEDLAWQSFTDSFRFYR